MQLSMALKQSAIALGLGRSASTVARELRRNGWVSPKAPRRPGRPAVAGGYRADAANEPDRSGIIAPSVEWRLQPG